MFKRVSKAPHVCAALLGALLAPPLGARAAPEEAVAVGRGAHVSASGSRGRGLELGAVPLVGGTTDIGFGVGALAVLADLGPGEASYRWRLEMGGFHATKSSFLQPTYDDFYVQLTVPRLFSDRVRMRIAASYTKETTLPYFGMGNAVSSAGGEAPARDLYERIHPKLLARIQVALGRGVSVRLGASYTHNWISTDPSSTLSRDMRSSNRRIRSLAHTELQHGVATAEAGLVYDTRDEEFSTNHGQHHQIVVRASPRIAEAIPHSYWQLNAIGRVYVSLIPRYLTFAVRGVFDLQRGDPPFYELSRYEESSAIGGGHGVRGVPAFTFYGKVKAFGNAELRSEVARVEIKGKPFALGLAAFADAGRLWADLNDGMSIDGRGVGLHYGVGGGVRVRQGRCFLGRADVAWSPDARPIGLYFTVGQMF